MEKIIVCDGVNDLKRYLETHDAIKICLYLAEKTKEAWDISTSRVYMNQINNNFIYLPVNLKKGDWDSIREVYTIAENDRRIIAINQTQPHKSNPVQKEWFSDKDIPINVDSLIKDENNKLQCYNLNGPSFTSWFEDEVSSFSDKKVDGPLKADGYKECKYERHEQTEAVMHKNIEQRHKDRNI